MSTVAGDSSSNSDTSSEADATSLSRAEMGGDATETGSLRAHFSELDGMPCERIFLVRQVRKPGLGSADAVRVHFSAYGVIEVVLNAYARKGYMDDATTYSERMR